MSCKEREVKHVDYSCNHDKRSKKQSINTIIEFTFNKYSRMR